MSILFGVIAGMLSMIGFGIANAFSKIIIKDTDELTTVFYRGIIIVMIILSVFVFSGSGVVLDYYAICYLVFASVIGFIALISFYKALGIGKISIVEPVAKSSVIITVVLAIIFLGERLTLLQSIGIASLIVGLILISTEFSKLKRALRARFSTGGGYALITLVLWGVFFFMVKKPSVTVGSLEAALIIEFSVFFFAMLSIPFRGLKKLDLGLIPLLIIVSIGSALGSLGFFYGIAYAPVSIVAPIAASSPLVTVMIAFLKFKEKIELNQKIAIFVILLGLVLVSI